MHRLSLIVAAVMLAMGGLSPTAAQAQQAAMRASPNLLTFGMTPDQASQALGTQLYYVRGRPGDELLLALPNVKGASLAMRSDGLYLQFRKGRLTGWKGDWGTIRP